MKKFMSLFVLMMCLILITACTTGKPQTKGVYIVATGPNYVPFSFMNEKTGKMDGFEIDLLQAIAKKGDFTVQFELVEWDGFITAIQRGRYDMGIYGVTITEERKNKVDFSDPYYHAGIIFMVHKDSNITSIDDLAKKKIGTVTRTTSEDYLRKNYPEAEIYAFLGSPELYMELNQGRIDAILYDVPSIQYYISKEKNSTFRTLGNVLQSEEYGILFPKGSPLTKRTNEILTELIDNGTYDDIYEKWFNKRPYGTK